MNKHRGFKIFVTILFLLVILPILYISYDRSHTLPPPPASWIVPTPYYTPGRTWEQYATEYLKYNPQPNALRHYLDAISLVNWNFSDSAWKEVTDIFKNDWTQAYPLADEVLQKNQPAIQEALAGAQMHQCEFPPLPLNNKSPTPNFLRMQNVGKMIVLNGKKLESQKNYHEAMQDYLFGIQFGKDLNQKNQFIISLFLSFAIIQMNTKPLLILISQDKLAKPDYLQLIKELPQLEKESVTFAEAFEREYRYIYIGSPHSLQDPYNYAQGLVSYSRATMYSFTQVQKTTMDEIKDAADIGYYTGYIFFNQNRISKNLVGYYADMLNVATTKTYREFMQIDWESRFPKDGVNLYPKYTPLPNLYTLQKIVSSRLRMAQIQAAIHLYHLKTKQWPKKLNDLEPEYIKKTPLDPFVDQPFHWSQDSAGPFVYSVGPDFKDDSLKVIYDPSNGTVSGGDIRP